MNIGTLNPNQQGNFVGRIQTLTIDLQIFLAPIHSDKPRAPKYEIRARNPAGNTVQIGAFWEQSSRASGECFLQGRIDDHTFREPLNISAFRQRDGSYNIVWQEQRRRNNAFDVKTPSGSETTLDPFAANEVGMETHHFDEAA